MRTMPQAIVDALATNDFTGPRKARTRVTIQKSFMGLRNVGTQVYATMPFHDGQDPARELPNVRSVTSDRAIDTDTATSTMTLWNTVPLPPGTGPDTAGSFDLLGYYTHNRGKSAYSVSDWGHAENQWQDFLVPDRLVRVYQGYGWNLAAVPELDTNLVLTGVWLIDDVTYSADGVIEVEMRDLSRLLTDHIMFPPVVPIAHYPLVFEQKRTVTTQVAVGATAAPTTGAAVPTSTTPVPQSGFVRPTYSKSSNYTEPQTQAGHHPRDAFDANLDSYWLSTGNEQPTGPAAFEWIEGKVTAGEVIKAVRFASWAGPYTAYLSLMVAGKWLGASKIPYDSKADRGGTSNYADIPFLQTVRVGKDATHIFQLPQAISGVQAVRITMTGLYNSGIKGLTAKAVYRCGVRVIEHTDQALDTRSVTTSTAAVGAICSVNTVRNFKYTYDPAVKRTPTSLAGTIRIQAYIPVLPAQGARANFGGTTSGHVLTAADALPGYPGWYSKDITGSVIVPFKVRITVGSCYVETFTEFGLASLTPTDSQAPVGATVAKTEIVGNYTDYSEIVKRLLAYGGFFWPQGGRQLLTNGNFREYFFPETDPFLSTETAEVIVGRYAARLISGYNLEDTFTRVNGPLGNAESGQAWQAQGPATLAVRGNAMGYPDATGVPNSPSTAGWALADIGTVEQRVTLSVVTTDPSPGNCKSRMLLRAKTESGLLTGIQVRIDRGLTPTTGSIVVQRIIHNTFTDIVIGPSNVSVPSTYEATATLEGDWLHVYIGSTLVLRHGSGMYRDGNGKGAGARLTDNSVNYPAITAYPVDGKYEENGGITFDTIRREADRLKYGNETSHFTPLPTTTLGGSTNTQDVAHPDHYYYRSNGATESEVDYWVNKIFQDRNVNLQAGGRVWGDILMSGTSGPAKLNVEVWDKKPIQDGINYVKDILGFIFHIDEQGAAQFRLPNIFRKGNWQTDVDGLTRTRTPAFKVLNDVQHVLTLRAKLSSRNVREKIFVANVNGKIGAVAKGRNPFPSGLRRVGGWTDQRFESEAECITMADLITLRQLFTYRQDAVRIPADPGVQIDDQIEIRERTSGEAYLHYVRAIRTDWNHDTGVWTMDLTTSWLGVDPGTEWAFRSSSLQQDTQTFLAALGEM